MISGSYPFSESYRIPLSSKDFIEKFKQFKDNHEEYKVFTVDKNGQPKELKDTLDQNFYTFWVNVGQDSTLFFVINSNLNTEGTHTEIKLVSLSEKQYFGDWKQINTDDLTDDENQQIKQLFQNKILSNFR